MLLVLWESTEDIYLFIMYVALWGTVIRVESLDIKIKIVNANGTYTVSIIWISACFVQWNDFWCSMIYGNAEAPHVKNR